MSLLRKACCYLITGLFCFNVHISSAQDQRVADILKNLYAQNQSIDSARLELLKQLSFNELNDNNKSD